MFYRPTRAMRRDLSQLGCAAAGPALGLAAPLVSAGPRVDARAVATLLFTLGFGVISLVSIIYSMLFLVVQFSASTFTPRLGLFRDEPIVWRAFAFTVGVFVFCISAGLAISARDRISVRGAGAVGWPAPVLVLVLQRIDVPALVRASVRHDGAVAFRVAPGRTVSRGMALAGVTGGPLPERVLRKTLVTGVERTFDQDPELPLRLLADITLRALSPAVNDPATAVESLDRMEDLLTRLADRDLDTGRFEDERGLLRVTVPVPGWEQYVGTAVDDVAFAAAGSPMALRRMRDLLGRLLAGAPEDRRAVVRERLEWVERTGSGAFPLIWTPYEGSRP